MANGGIKIMPAELGAFTQWVTLSNPKTPDEAAAQLATATAHAETVLAEGDLERVSMLVRHLTHARAVALGSDNNDTVSAFAVIAGDVEELLRRASEKSAELETAQAKPLCEQYRVMLDFLHNDPAHAYTRRSLAEKQGVDPNTVPWSELNRLGLTTEEETEALNHAFTPLDTADEHTMRSCRMGARLSRVMLDVGRTPASAPPVADPMDASGFVTHRPKIEIK